MRRMQTLAWTSATLLILSGLGCVSVRAPERINVNSSPGRSRIDTSRVPPTRDHADAREKLAQAYDRIDYLERKVNYLEKDKDELKDELNDARRRADRND